MSTRSQKNVGFPIKLLVKEQRTRMIIALQSDPRFESTYWASLSLCALPFLTMESTAVMLYEAGVEKILWCAEASRIVSMWCRGGVIDPHFTAVILFAVFFASRPPLARLHHPLLPIFLLAQRSGGAVVEERLRLQMPQTDSSAPVNKKGLCAKVTSHKVRPTSAG